MDGIIERAMGEPQPDDFADRSRLLGHVWYSSIVGWVNGRTDLARVHGEVAIAVRLLLGGGCDQLQGCSRGMGLSLSLVPSLVAASARPWSNAPDAITTRN